MINNWREKKKSQNDIKRCNDDKMLFFSQSAIVSPGQLEVGVGGVTEEGEVWLVEAHDVLQERVRHLPEVVFRRLAGIVVGVEAAGRQGGR